MTKELKVYRIQKDNDDLANTINQIEETMNPFTGDPDENLYCISSGKRTDDGIKDNLLNVQTIRNKWCEKFLTGCLRNPL